MLLQKYVKTFLNTVISENLIYSLSFASGIWESLNLSELEKFGQEKWIITLQPPDFKNFYNQPFIYDEEEATYAPLFPPLPWPLKVGDGERGRVGRVS